LEIRGSHILHKEIPRVSICAIAANFAALKANSIIKKCGPYNSYVPKKE